MRKGLEIGGVVAAAILVAFGIAAIVMGVNGRSTVRDSLKLEQIVGSPDMTPAAIKVEAQKAGLPASVKLPTVDVAGKQINTGARARAFASYMRIHALEATGGLTYSQMGRFVAKPGAPAKFTDGHGGTSDEKYAALDPKTQRPVDNGLRNLWVTETALTTALNTSYMAEQQRDADHVNPSSPSPPTGRLRAARRVTGRARPDRARSARARRGSTGAASA